MGGGPRGLIGREAEIGEALDALAQGRAVAVRGAPGMGTTTVLGEIARRFPGPHLLAVGVDFLDAQHLLPFERALERPLRGDLVRAASEIRASVGDGGLVVVDNVHRLDPGSRALLALLADRGPLLVGLRTVGPGGAGSLDLVHSLEALEIELGPLTTGESLALMESCGPAASRSVVADVAARAGGNPLLIELLVRDQGALDGVGQELVEAALLDLSPGALEVLATMALGLPIGADAEATSELIVAGIVQRTARGLVPAAAVLAETALTVLPPAVKARLHRSAAAREHDPAIAAVHHLAAGDRVQAYRLVTEAIGRREPDPPSSLLRFALDLCPPEDETVLLERTVLALCWEGDMTGAGRVVHDARERGHAGPDVVAAEAMIAMAELDHVRALTLLDSVVDTVHPELRSVVLALRAAAKALSFDISGALDDAHESLDLDPTVSSAPMARMVLGASALLSGDPTWRDQMVLALKEARVGRNRGLELQVGTTLAFGTFVSDGTEAGLAVCDDLVARAVELDDEGTEMAVQAMRCGHQILGELAPESTLVELDRLLRYRGPRDAPNAPGWAFVALGWSDRGEPVRARAASVRAEEALSETDPRRLQSIWVRAEIAWAAGELAWAAEHAARGLALGSLVNPSHAACAALQAWSQFEAGQTVTVQVPYIPYRLVAGHGLEIRAVAALAEERWQDAVGLFTEAADLADHYFRRSGLRARWGRVEGLRRGGETEAALVELDALIEDCANAGIRFLDTRLAASRRACVAASGKAARRTGGAPPTGGATLTPRQLEVLSLLRGGLSSREVAERLGLSTATVETHVRDAMRRLGTTSRAEAARLAAPDVDSRP